ncbi:hypothetical protein YC2023_019117 [Brassica napus]
MRRERRLTTQDSWRSIVSRSISHNVSNENLTIVMSPRNRKRKRDRLNTSRISYIWPPPKLLITTTSCNLQREANNKADCLEKCHQAARFGLNWWWVWYLHEVPKNRRRLSMYKGIVMSRQNWYSHYYSYPENHCRHWC